MSFPINYQQAMTKLARLTEPDQPGYVQVKALATLVRELSPANPHQRANHLALGLDPHPETSADTEQPALPEGPWLVLATSEDDLTEEDDDDYP